MTFGDIGKTWLLRGIPEGDNRTLARRMRDGCPQRSAHPSTTTRLRCGGCGLFLR